MADTDNARTTVTEAQREDALRVLRADYFDDVRGCAKDIYDEAKGHAADNEPGLREWLHDHMHEVVDGHSRVIYTGLAIETLLFSDNDSAFVDDFGTEGIVRDGNVHWSGLAYAAFERDVQEQLEALGMDLNDDNLGFEEEKPEEEDPVDA